MFKEMKDGVKEDIVVGSRLGCWITASAAIVVVLSIISVLLWPVLNNLWIKGFRTTNEYRSTKEALLYQLKAQYEKNDVKIAELGKDSEQSKAIKGQQIAILDRMEKEMSLLSNAGSVVPSDVSMFVRSRRK
jgi:hypothetical protein